jgi:outer membrane protein assembly factor BamB
MIVKKYVFITICSIAATVFSNSCKKNVTTETETSALSTITANEVTLISLTSAVFGGHVTDYGGLPLLEKGICFNTSPTPTVSNTKIISTNLTDTFTINLINLSFNTTYYVRAYAKNNIGISYGNEVRFQTNLNMATTDPATIMFISGGYNNSLFALNAEDRSLKWKASLAGVVFSSPIYSNGKVYVGCQDNKLYAFDTLGILKWSVSTDGNINKQSPIAADGNIYISDSKGIYAFNADNGSLVWKFPKDNGSAPGGTLIVKNRTLYSNVYNL